MQDELDELLTPLMGDRIGQIRALRGVYCSHEYRNGQYAPFSLAKAKNIVESWIDNPKI